MSFTIVTLTATFDIPDSFVAGYVDIQPTCSMWQPGGDIYPAVPQSINVPDGTMSVDLAANDDSATLSSQPKPGYIITENLGGAPYQYKVIIPHTASGGTIDLSQLTRYPV